MSDLNDGYLSRPNFGYMRSSNLQKVISARTSNLITFYKLLKFKYFKRRLENFTKISSALAIKQISTFLSKIYFYI